jgi:hypothetical protein
MFDPYDVYQTSWGYRFCGNCGSMLLSAFTATDSWGAGLVGRDVVPDDMTVSRKNCDHYS